MPKTPKARFTPAYEEFLRLIVEARKTVGMNQVELAKRLHKPQPFVSKYERGVRRLDIVECLLICRALGIDALHLIKKLIHSDAFKKTK